MIQRNLILTKKELEVIEKKLKNKSLTQQDSNYLSRFVRPKLKAMNLIDSKKLLEKLEYNPKIISIENKIKKTILAELKNVLSITIYGSAIQTNYKNYNDIDILVVVKKKFWKKLNEKYEKIYEIKKQLKKNFIDLDLEIYDKIVFRNSYPSNISLIYQLEDSRTIYGKLKLPAKLLIPKLNLRMKVDYSIIEDEEDGIEIYKAIRNLILVILIEKKILSNEKLIETIDEEIGKNLTIKLKSNKESAIEKKIAMLHLKRLLKLILNKLKTSKWEKIVLLNQ